MKWMRDILTCLKYSAHGKPRDGENQKDTELKQHYNYTRQDTRTLTNTRSGHIRTRQGHIRTRLGHIRTRLGHICTRQGHIRTRQGHIRTRQEHIRTRLGHIRIRQGHIRTRQGHICTRQGHNRTRLCGYAPNDKRRKIVNFPAHAVYSGNVDLCNDNNNNTHSKNA